ncbi:hypothetical protein GCM10022377_18050 [Zhihengliuella alba]|uniref:Uncharacterized protein n=1 Tax=Zhihengliuella alba TaxID=547018 RepID=A0ABP7DEX6_9MICC
MLPGMTQRFGQVSSFSLRLMGETEKMFLWRDTPATAGQIQIPTFVIETARRAGPPNADRHPVGGGPGAPTTE